MFQLNNNYSLDVSLWGLRGIFGGEESEWVVHSLNSTTSDSRFKLFKYEPEVLHNQMNLFLCLFDDLHIHIKFVVLGFY